MSLAVRNSKLGGRGLFATRTFNKGERIIEYFGTLLTNEEADRSRSRYLFALTSKVVIEGNHTANTARYINHSCRPNAIAKGIKRLHIYALKKIRPEDEITLDYGEEYKRQFLGRCRCGNH